jgi:acetoin utilization deacetylase AcuC-like enzyme
MTLLYTDPLFLKHDTGRHPEKAARLRSIVFRLHRAGLDKKCQPGTYKPLDEAVVAKLHTPLQVMKVKQLAEHGGGHLTADTMVSVDSYKVGLAAAGACVAAVDAVLAGPEHNALCLVRPPGHHATHNQSMGFCLFNNIALAAKHALTNLGLSRVLIVDWDVHHGNGTQDIFEDSGQVMFLSIHRYGHGFYPGTGAENETGRGKGLGYTLNAPVRLGISRHDFLTRFYTVLEKAADKIKPELVLMSAGFDAHVLDPVGGLKLEAEDYAGLTKSVLEVARTHAKGRLVSCLEGGYHLFALAESVQVHLEELLAEPKH